MHFDSGAWAWVIPAKGQSSCCSLDGEGIHAANQCLWEDEQHRQRAHHLQVGEGPEGWTFTGLSSPGDKAVLWYMVSAP